MNDHFQGQLPTGVSVYSCLEQCARQYADHTAIAFYGKTLTYRQLLDKIDETAKALIALGIQRDDVVAASLPGMPEGIFLIYAINKIGAVYCAFDCRSKREEIEETVRVFSPKLCVVPNFQVKELQNILTCPIVYISPIHFLGGVEKFYSIPANFFTGRDLACAKNKNIMKYDRFIRAGQSIGAYPTLSSSQDIFGYFYTSGTTFGRKSVILTNQNVNAAATIQKLANKDIRPGERLLNIMPLFTCYSVTLAMHLPLICGVCVDLIPLVNTKKMKKTLLNEKPNYIITVPAHWEYFVRDSFEGCDLSFMKLIVVGGDTMSPEFRDRLNGIFETYGCCKPLRFGYGLTETASTATAALSVPESSVGQALPCMQLGIFDPDTGKALSAGQEGEICICGPTVCRGYFRDPEATEKLLKLHDDGKLWLHSGDRGYLDDTGALYFCERYKRMYVRFDGTKISPYSIEQVIAACPQVEQVLVVAVADTAHSHGMCPKAYIIPKKSKSKKAAHAAIQKYCRKHLDMHMQLAQIVISDSLPHTKNGKLRYFE